MNLLAKSAWEEDEQVECIGADVFLRRLVINLHPTNLAIIAPGAHVFFWEGGEIGCSCSLDCAVFWLFPEVTTRASCCFSSICSGDFSWANADDESSPSAHTVRRNLLMLTLPRSHDDGCHQSGVTVRAIT